jgi:hypothetical protein
MSHDAGLNAAIDPTWMRVILTARGIRNADLRALAEAFAEDREHVIAELTQLAAALDRPAEGWDEAVDDFEANMQLDEASLGLDERDARQLAAELDTAADRTYTARARVGRPLTIPRQQDRRVA